jgi:TolB-like protein
MKLIFSGLMIAALVLLAGCGGMGATKFVHPDFDFAFIEKIAVVPFENLANDQTAGAQATRYFTSSLLATEAFEVVEPGEVARILESFGVVRTSQLTTDQVLTLGKELGVQAVFLGSLSEASSMRSGATTVNVVTVVCRLLETETAATVWSATNTEDSSSFWSSLFGTGQKPPSVVMRKCIDGCLDTLMD